jgi:hypothetical protein
VIYPHLVQFATISLPRGGEVKMQALSLRLASTGEDSLAQHGR